MQFEVEVDEAAAAAVTMSGLMLPVWLPAGQREEREA